MKINFFLLLYLLFTFSVFSQMQASHWISGKGTHIQFPFGETEINTNFPLSNINIATRTDNFTYEGSSSISDVNGNLKLYTNSIDVYNANNQKINTNRLKGNYTVTQSSIFIPYPGKYNQYILFTINGVNLIAPNNDVSVGFDLGLYYYEIDLNKNQGNGELIAPANNRLLTRTAEKISAVYHENGEDIWVVTYFENKFHAYLVTKNGVQNPIISQVPYFSSVSGYAANSKGYLKISPLGNKIAIAHQNEVYLDNIPTSVLGDGYYFFSLTHMNQEYPGKLFLYDFDKSTGKVTNEQKFNYNLLYYGIEFSPSGEYLYFQYIEDVFNAIMRVDVNDLSRFSNLELLDPEMGYWGGAFNIGVNGKIYHTVSSNSLSIIDQPNINSTEYSLNSQNLNTNAIIGKGLPNFIVDYLKEELKVLNSFDGVNACVNTPLKFWVNNNKEIETVFWDLGDGTTSTQIVPTHTYTTEGTYTVTAVINGITYTKTIIIHKPIDLPVYEMTECDTNNDNTAGYNLQNFIDYLGDNAAYVSFHSSRNEAENNINPIENLTFQGNQNSPPIFARVINTGGCISITEIRFKLNQSSISNQTETLCKQFDNGYFLSLSSIEDLFEHSINIFPSHTDAENLTNHIRSNFQLSETQNELTVFVREQNFEDCDNIIQLQLFLNNPTVFVLEDQSICPFNGSINYQIPENITAQHIQWNGLQGDDLNQNLNSSSIQITHPGEYSLTITNQNGCSFTDNFTVTASETINVITSIDQTSTFKIDYLENNPNDYIFSLDEGLTWNEGNTYNNLPIGNFTLWIKEKNNSQCIVYEEIIKNNKLTNFFSPNGDGINDLWRINGFEKYEWIDVLIYNRYGKEIVKKRINYSNILWDGRNNGKIMSSNSYWYKLTTSTNDTFEGYVVINNSN